MALKVVALLLGFFTGQVVHACEASKPLDLKGEFFQSVAKKLSVLGKSKFVNSEVLAAELKETSDVFVVNCERWKVVTFKLRDASESKGENVSITDWNIDVLFSTPGLDVIAVLWGGMLHEELTQLIRNIE